jgi:hypothetical protein
MFSTPTPTAPPAGNAQQSTGTTQPSLFSGFGQQQSQPAQPLFGNTQQQQQPGTSLLGQSNPSGSAPGPFGSSTATAGQPSTAAGGPPAFGGSWNSGNPLLPKSAFGGGTSTGINQPQQQGTGTGPSLFGQQQQQQQQQQSTAFGGGSLFGSTQNQIQQP